MKILTPKPGTQITPMVSRGESKEKSFERIAVSRQVMIINENPLTRGVMWEILSIYEILV